MAFQLRDPAGAYRAVAHLLMAAGPFILLTGVVLPEEHRLVVVAVFVLLSIFLGGVGAVCRWRPERLPGRFWLVAPFLGVALVTTLNLATRDASAGAQLFYLWPVLYAANFLSRTVIYLIITLVSVSDGGVVFALLGTSRGVSDWASMTVAMGLTAIVVTALRNRNESLRRNLETQAYADPLTGVANRRSFDAELARGVAWARATGSPIALLTLDVDHFKKINDTWGHAVGDRALRVVAEALKGVARRDGDVAGRLGGDEFVVLLRTDGIGASRAADEIRAAVGGCASLPGGPPGLSIGVAVLPDHAGTAGELTAASDAALYEAKAEGRGRTAIVVA
jgi:diguanylate cyclase (GGDEF)-like protein